MPPGVSLDYADQKARQVESTLADLPEVEPLPEPVPAGPPTLF